MIKENILYRIEQNKIGDKSLLDGFSIKPIEAKKTVIRHYNQMIEASLGCFEISGDNMLLNYLYSCGVGSRTSAGFGMFEVL